MSNKKSTKATKKHATLWSRFKNTKFRNGVIAVVAGLVVLSSGVLVYESQAYVYKPCVFRQFSIGSHDPCVGYIQAMVNYMSPANKTIKVDTYFGPQTKGTAYPYGGVLYVQGRLGLGVDGIVGPKTWEALCTKGNHAAESGVRYDSYSYTYAFNQAECFKLFNAKYN